MVVTRERPSSSSTTMLGSLDWRMVLSPKLKLLPLEVVVPFS